MFKQILKSFFLLFKPFVWWLANIYDIKVYWHCRSTGQNDLVIENIEESKKIYQNRVFLIHAQE